MKNIDYGMRLFTASLLMLLLLCGVALAENHPIDEQVDRCMDEDPSTSGMIDCAEEGEKLWDQELNRVYKELMGLLPKEGQEALRTAQRAWIPWRDSEYRLNNGVYNAIYNSIDGGTMWVVQNAFANMEVVRKRTLQLTDWLDELKAGNPSYPHEYPAKQTDEQLEAAMRVKNDSAALGKAIGENGADIASKNLKAWEALRNKDVQFMAIFYGKRGDKGFPLHARMQMNVKRAEYLNYLYTTLMEQTVWFGPEPKPKRKGG